jgi:plasmid stabilization system protein ParE
MLSVFPFSGKLYEELNINIEIRSLTYEKYIAFYIVRNNIVEILFILNSAQNIKSILSYYFEKNN